MSNSALQRMAAAAGAAVEGALMKSHGGESAASVTELENATATLQPYQSGASSALPAAAPGDPAQITMKDGSTASGVVSTSEVKDTIGRTNRRSYAKIEGKRKPVRVYATADGGWTQSKVGRPGKPPVEHTPTWKPVHYDYLAQLKAGQKTIKGAADGLGKKFSGLLNAHAALQRAEFIRVNPKNKEVTITSKGIKFLDARPAAAGEAPPTAANVAEMFGTGN